MTARIPVSVIAALFAVLFAAPKANAEALINVNFNRFTPSLGDPEVESTLEGPAGGLGTSWNQYAANSSSGTMVDSTGEATTVTVATNFSEGRYDGTGASLTMLRATLTDFARGASRTVTISGLEAEVRYDVWLVGHRHQATLSERVKGTWTSVNSTTSATTQLVDGTAGALNGATFVAGVNYALFANVVANGSGQIVFNGKGATIADGYEADYRLGLSGLQIEESGDLVAGPMDPDGSSVEAAPLTVVADGVATSTVTVTLKDADGIVIAGKSVSLANTAGPQQATIVPAIAQTTDKFGRAAFTVSSLTGGTEVFSATNDTDDIEVTQTASVEFVKPTPPLNLFSVNFNGFTGGNPGPTQEESTLEGPAGGLGTSWNQYAANSSSGWMVDSTGAPTTVTVATNFSEGRYDGTGASLTMVRATLTDFAKGVASRTVTISGLKANGRYDIWLVSHRHQASTAERQKGTWTADNSTTSTTTQLVDGTAGALNGATFVAGVNYALFENVVADGAGQIVFTGTAARVADGYDADYRLHLNGIQLLQGPPTGTLITVY